MERLTAAVRQAGQIRRGENEPLRQWTIEITAFDETVNSHKSWAICVADEDEELVPRKIYEIEVFPALSNVRVVDEAGEAVLCPKRMVCADCRSADFGGTISADGLNNSALKS